MKYNERIRVEFMGKYAVLTDPLWIRTDLVLANKTFTFQISSGFKTDFASIPRVFWFFVAPSEETVRVASIAHDYLYSKKKINGFILEGGELKEKVSINVNRLLADCILREKMKSFKAGFIKRNLVFLAVRLFGWIFYQKRLKKLIKKYL